MPQRLLVKTSTNRNVDNQNVDKPKRRQTKTSTNRNVDKPKRRQTKTHAHLFRSTSERSGAHMYHLFIDEIVEN